MQAELEREGKITISEATWIYLLVSELEVASILHVVFPARKWIPNAILESNLDLFGCFLGYHFCKEIFHVEFQFQFIFSMSG